MAEWGWRSGGEGGGQVGEEGGRALYLKNGAVEI